MQSSIHNIHISVEQVNNRVLELIHNWEQQPNKCRPLVFDVRTGISCTEKITIPYIPFGVKHLDIDCKITQWPTLPETLKTIICVSDICISDTKILPQSLQKLTCNKLMVKLNAIFPPKLKHLDISFSNICELPELPNTLEKLIIDYTNIRRIESLPQKLKYFDCQECGLELLPPLPEGLRYLNCSSGVLTKLPPLPSTLRVLLCSYNKLREFPKLPDGLVRLECDYNLFHRLPDELPSGISDRSYYSHDSTGADIEYWGIMTNGYN